MNDTADYPVQDKDAPAELPPSARLMLRIVYIMGVILVLLFLTLVIAIIWKATRKAEPKPEPGPALIDLGLPAGAVIQSAQAAGDRLIISTGQEVIVVDLRRNSIIARISAGPR